MMRIGLLGASRIAPNAVIAPAAARTDVTVSVVAAQDPARAAAFAAEHGIPAVAADYAELVARDDVDVVYCALPAPMHLDICEQALAAGKALLVEKPFAVNAEAARRIVAAALPVARRSRPSTIVSMPNSSAPWPWYEAARWGASCAATVCSMCPSPGHRASCAGDPIWAAAR